MSTRILAVVTALLLAFAVHQYNQIGDLRRALANAQANGMVQGRKAAVASLEGYGPELQRTMQWLDDYYKAADGLQRPEGLWVHNRPDFEGIGAWVYSVYLTNRMNGSTEEQSRQTVVDAIRRSDEWRQKHRTTP